MQKKKNTDEKQLKKLQSTALKIGRTVEMDHVRRRLSSSSNNVSNMRLDGALGIPLQAGLRIRIHFIRIRIQLRHFRLNTDPDPGL
jgi:hypothetical protein